MMRCLIRGSDRTESGPAAEFGLMPKATGAKSLILFEKSNGNLLRDGFKNNEGNDEGFTLARSSGQRLSGRVRLA